MQDNGHRPPEDDDDIWSKFTARDWVVTLAAPIGFLLVIYLVLFFQVLEACDAARIEC